MISRVMRGACLIGAISLVVAIEAGMTPSRSQTLPQINSTEAMNRFFDAEKPDPKQLDDLRAAANRPVPPGLSSGALARFLDERGKRRRLLGMVDGSIADFEAAIKAGGRDESEVLGTTLSLAYAIFEKGGQHRKALSLFTEIERRANRPGVKGRMFGAQRGIGRVSVALGETRRAEQALGRARALLSEARYWPPFAQFGTIWQANVEALAVDVAMSNQNFAEAEAGARRAETLFRRVAAGRGDAFSREDRDQFAQAADFMLIQQGRAKLSTGRLAEAETDGRAAIISRIRYGGKYQLAVADQLGFLRFVKFQQGRYEDAAEISRRIFEILDQLGTAHDSPRYVRALNAEAWITSRLGKREATDAAYARVDQATENWPEQDKIAARNPPHRVSYLSNTGRSAQAVDAARASYERLRARLGDDDYNTGFALATYANTLSRTGNVAEGLKNFRRALPVIIDNRAEDRDDIDAGGTQGLDVSARLSILNFIFAVSRGEPDKPEAIAEAFQYSEAIRADGVQRALAAASARAAARDPQIGALVRREQDLEKEIARSVANLQLALAQPSDQRDAKAILALRGDIEKMRRDRARMRQDIEKKAPSYSDLVSPAPPSIADIQKVLQPGEVFLAVNVGDRGSFVWAIPAQGPAQFHASELGRIRVGELVDRVRKGLDLGGSTLLDIPAFDLEASATLYQQLLRPVEATIDKGDRLIVVANGALGSLPFGLLSREVKSIDANAEPMFSAYRDAPWLIRTHAITTVPSAAALRTLRIQRKADDSKRLPFIGFGDPQFSKGAGETAASSSDFADPAEVTSRGVKAAKLAFRNMPMTAGAAAVQFSQLPQLPDTAEELSAIAKALGADPASSVYLGTKANERFVRQAKLDNYKVVAFATHGLVPGELPGLKVPALALSAPDAAGVDGDGLLTMDEILQLKLDADWVVLSACNTAAGAGDGAGAEAASGLGRAFFYAGSKALLVTGWAVHSASARELVSEVFRRQADGSDVERSKALRSSMLRLMDEGAIKDAEGAPVASYAHPVFWAPYILIGDGGAG